MCSGDQLDFVHVVEVEGRDDPIYLFADRGQADRFSAAVETSHGTNEDGNDTGYLAATFKSEAPINVGAAAERLIASERGDVLEDEGCRGWAEDMRDGMTATAMLAAFPKVTSSDTVRKLLQRWAEEDTKGRRSLMAGRKRSSVERTWQAHGLECAVLILDMGHRCGYVRVPDDHPWEGLDYDDKVPEAEASDFEGHALAGNTDDWSRRVEGHVAVHGGVTYAGKQPNGDCAEGWWFGFDCAHLDDTPERWTLDAVVAETERMAEQVAGASEVSK